MKQMVYGHLVHLVIRIADKCIRLETGIRRASPAGAEAKQVMMRGEPRRARRGNTSAGSLVRTVKFDEQVIR